MCDYTRAKTQSRLPTQGRVLSLYWSFDWLIDWLVHRLQKIIPRCPNIFSLPSPIHCSTQLWNSNIPEDKFAPLTLPDNLCRWLLGMMGRKNPQRPPFGQALTRESWWDSNRTGPEKENFLNCKKIIDKKNGLSWSEKKREIRRNVMGQRTLEKLRVIGKENRSACRQGKWWFNTFVDSTRGSFFPVTIPWTLLFSLTMRILNYRKVNILWKTKKS